MATIKFQIRSKQKDKAVPIYVNISLGRGQVFRCKSGFFINYDSWSETRGYPKQNDVGNKQLNNKLKTLEKYLLDQINAEQSDGGYFSKEYFEHQIEECFNRDNVHQDNGLLLNYVQHIIDNAATRKIKGKSKVGLSENTVKNYNTFKQIVEEYEKFLRRPIRFRDISLDFVDHFKEWLLNVKDYSVNHAGKSIAFIKSLSKEAERLGIAVHPQIHLIEGFAESNEDRYIVTLSSGELERIRKVELKSKALENARKWLLIGCEIGQRGGDLLEIKESMIRETVDCKVIDVKQQKTGKTVAVAVTPEVERLIQEGFPYKIPIQKFNDHIKELAKLAKIVEPTEGKKFNKETGRKELGKYPKHELITSHTCRRSFATNNYKKVPTTVLMGITGHSKESTFLAYINKPKDMDENAKMFLKYMNGEKM